MSEHDAARFLRQDDEARARALDVRGSFLVQAPAGSGKTELLIQRCLALLARVDEPERIVALTFTRKAAGEMRERVVEALVAAQRGEALDAARPHEHTTRGLALAALAQDARRGWSLTEHPARLRILTFDSLTTWIVRSAPFAAMLGPAPAYTEDAKGLYAAAAVAAIAVAKPDDPHWRRLLVHLHNDAGQTADLLAQLLAKRDQWLRQLGAGDTAGMRAALERALRDELASALAVLEGKFPADLGVELARLARLASRELAADPSKTALAQALEQCAACGGRPDCTVECLPLWRMLAQWLLTKDGEPRRTIDKNAGFPAPGKDVARAEAKQSMLALLGHLRAVPDLATTLHGVAQLPEPHALADDAWAIVEALLHVVPRAAAQLNTTFAEHGEVDFAQASLAALAALGDAEAPGELLQRLDYRLAHLLVDEFQDTSATQLELLRRLTAGWTPGEDGRTIFAVGDPMQSIYRFREAEVRLFVEAQLAGEVAGIPVECLTLRRNFRSQARLVDWVSDAFPAVLGRDDDPLRGAVAFKAAIAAKPALPHEVSLDVATDAQGEAQAVVRRVREAQGAGAENVAILVRARAHLAAILPALREAGIEFAAVELDSLAQRQAVQDLASLTHALLQPGDRLAWLAVLRAPWCGLALPDLVAFTQAAGHAPLGAVLGDAAVLEMLSDDGRARLARVRPVLDAAFASHGCSGVVSRVRGAWLALGGPACLDDPVDLETAERYFDLLARHERAGDVPDWNVFRAALGDLRAVAEAAQPSVQVMTMHKAKGLQFDTVILPGLAQPGRAPQRELIRWRSRERGLLIAPLPSPGADSDALFEYLKRLEKEEEAAELGRLLYVACTRAQVRLHLVAAPRVREDEQGNLAWRVAASSSLARLWHALEARAGVPTATAAVVNAAASPPPLLRLPLAYAPERPGDGLPPLDVPAPLLRDAVPFDWAQESARVVGTLAHRLLARMADGEPWDEAQLGAMAPRVHADLATAGFAADEAAAATQRVLDAVRRTLADERGRWLFARSHGDAHSEWCLAGVDHGELVHVVLDRTFVENGARWIVDFKTGVHEGGDTAGFLDREALRYREQLQRYGRLARALDGRPVRLALYYPLLEGGFREIADV